MLNSLVKLLNSFHTKATFKLIKVAYPVSQAASEASPRPSPTSAKSALLLSPTSSCPMFGRTLTDWRGKSDILSTPSVHFGRDGALPSAGTGRKELERSRAAVFDQLINIGRGKFSSPPPLTISMTSENYFRKSDEGWRGGQSTQGKRTAGGFRFVTVNLW